jgi:hypothetical protein
MKHAGFIAMLSAGLVGAGLLSITPAAATEFCDVRKTPDGFVALRTSPNPKAKLVARMKAGDEVLGDSTVDSVKGWIYVTWWKGGRFKTGKPNGYDDPSGKGWVYGKFIDELCG